MKKNFKKLVYLSLIILLLSSFKSFSQVLEWRLVNPTYSPIDPDGAGPALGSVSFTLQIHTVSGSISNITGLSTGWSWQSTKAMLPTGPAPIPTCGTNSVLQPSNITMSSTFAALGFTYNNVNQCSGTVNFTTGGQIFDRRASGTIDGGNITLTTTWVDVFTVTLWTLDNANPRGGYVVINSGAGGSPGAFSTYAVADIDAIEYVVNSLTYTTPLPLTSLILPVFITKFDAQCLPNKTTSITWSTSSESNNNYFEVEKSLNGTDWKAAGKINAAGNSVTAKNYQLTDPQGGAAQYRLKQVDKDGKITYSGIVRSTCDGRNVFVSLYPVPARDLLTLVVGSEKTIKTNLQIFDSKGRMVKSMPVSINKGQNSIQLRVESLAAGEYILKGTSPELEISQRFTILR